MVDTTCSVEETQLGFVFCKRRRLADDSRSQFRASELINAESCGLNATQARFGLSSSSSIDAGRSVLIVRRKRSSVKPSDYKLLRTTAALCAAKLSNL
jgi:hypothetical protein